MTARRAASAPPLPAGNGDEAWMREALAEGARGLGMTTPNPAVGCVLVKAGREVARGHYRGRGGPHAEAVALAAAGARARGATAYVTLEPHAHQGRTPPCTEALIAAGVRRVVIGCVDPHAKVAGRGVRQLRRAGLDVRVGVLKEDCLELIRGYRRFIVGRGPLVHLKMAVTLDGRIAARGGHARWISGEASRTEVQQLRARAEAILVGIGTVLADDPRLDCRLRGRPTPMRVVLDPRLEMPPRARMLGVRGHTLVVASPAAPALRERRLAAAGAEVVRLDTRGRRGWARLLAELARRGVMELLVEGGSAVATSVLAAGVVGRLSLFVAPRLMGGDGVPMAASLGVSRASSAMGFRTLRLRRVGEDLWWEGEPR